MSEHRRGALSEVPPPVSWGQACELAGCTVRQVHYWVQEGLLKAPTRDGWFWPPVLNATIIRRLVASGIPLQAVKKVLAETSESSLLVLAPDGEITVTDRQAGAQNVTVVLDLALVTAELRQRWPWPNRPDPDPIVA